MQLERAIALASKLRQKRECDAAVSHPAAIRWEPPQSAKMLRQPSLAVMLCAHERLYFDTCAKCRRGPTQVLINIAQHDVNLREALLETSKRELADWILSQDCN